MVDSTVARISRSEEKMEDGDQKVKPENNDGGVGNDQITIIVKQQGQSKTYTPLHIREPQKNSFIRSGREPTFSHHPAGHAEIQFKIKKKTKMGKVIHSLHHVASFLRTVRMCSK